MSTDVPRRRDLLINDLAAAMKIAFDSKGGVWVSCINCIHFNEQTVICAKYRQTPPPRVIALGCPAYEDDNDVPF